MKRPSLCAAAIFFGLGVPVSAQSWPPPEGQPVDAARTFPQLQEQPCPCLSIATGRATSILPMEAVRRVSQVAADGQQEARSEALLRLRARKALQHLATTKDSFGCSHSAGTTEPDNQFVASAFIERGQAFVAMDGAVSGVPAVTIRYLADGMMGNILYYVPTDDRPFFQQSWWVR